MARMRGDVDWHLHATQTCLGTVAMRNCLGQPSALHTNVTKEEGKWNRLANTKKIKKKCVDSNNSKKQSLTSAYHLLLFIRIKVLCHKVCGILLIFKMILMHVMMLMPVAMMVVDVGLMILWHVAIFVHFETKRFQLIVFDGVNVLKAWKC